MPDIPQELSLKIATLLPILVISTAAADDSKLRDVINDAQAAPFAQSIAIQLNLRDDFKKQDGIYSGRFQRLKDILHAQAHYRKTVSPDETFRDQLSIGHCTATLIRKNLILTAGHCVPTKAHCKITGWKFDFFSAPYETNESDDRVSFEIPATSVYQCKKIQRIKPNWNLLNTIGTPDYALITLDRDVLLDSGKPRPTAKVADQVVTQTVPEVFTLGFPFGLPMKISSGSNMTMYGSGFGTSQLVVYPGSSGSSIFNQATGEIIGVLSSGDPSSYANEDEQGQLQLRHRKNVYKNYIYLVSKELLKLR